MHFRISPSILFLTALFASIQAWSENKQQPTVTIDLRPLGAAQDLFTDQSDSRYQQRGAINLFWLGNDRAAVAFSTNRRWSSEQKPEPLQVRLIVFDRTGKQLNDRTWNFSDEGPDATTTLELSPGPENTILAAHVTSSTGKIPEGDFLQVLNPDTSIQQNFYVPATSQYVAGITPDHRLVLQTFYADKHSSLAWWSGKPLKAGATLQIPPGRGDLLAGPEAAARGVCQVEGYCSGIQVFRVGAATWMYQDPSPDLTPTPRIFLSPTSLLIELSRQTPKESALLIAHADGKWSPFPVLPKGGQLLAVTGLSTDGQRLSLDVAGEVGVCGALELWCKERAQALVVDVVTNKVLFQEGISNFGGVSALSPDGRNLAIFDKDKLAIYQIP